MRFGPTTIKQEQSMSFIEFLLSETNIRASSSEM